MKIENTEYTEAELIEIIRQCKIILPYILSTLAPRGNFLIDSGRADSSYDQLYALAKLVEKKNEVHY